MLLSSDRNLGPLHEWDRRLESPLRVGSAPRQCLPGRRHYMGERKAAGNGRRLCCLSPRPPHTQHGAARYSIPSAACLEMAALTADGLKTTRHALPKGTATKRVASPIFTRIKT